MQTLKMKRPTDENVAQPSSILNVLLRSRRSIRHAVKSIARIGRKSAMTTRMSASGPTNFPEVVHTFNVQNRDRHCLNERKPRLAKTLNFENRREEGTSPRVGVHS